MLHRAIFTLLLAFLSQLTYAHALMGGSGFTAGLLHPILGIDHLLAMVSVGILSAQAIWAVPAAFVSCMAVGGTLGNGRDPLAPRGARDHLLSDPPRGDARSSRHVSCVGRTWAGRFLRHLPRPCPRHGDVGGLHPPLVHARICDEHGGDAPSRCGHRPPWRTDTEDQLLRYLGAGIAGVGVHILYELLMPLEAF